MAEQAAMASAGRGRRPGRCNMRGSCGKSSVFSPDLPCALEEVDAKQVSQLVPLNVVTSLTVTPARQRAEKVGGCSVRTYILLWAPLLHR